MRLDKFLKVSRIIKRRSVANEFCDAQRVCVNGKIARASHKLKIGDVIEADLANRHIKIKVISLNETVRKENCTDLYSIVD
ncbi:MAG: RNA-binding S4 domain-containing protein [Clostridia bacterium]|nr:RNA-binding S4 domain-containing protein [Clostridia bacterium]